MYNKTRCIMMMAVFTVAACGLGYELVISALASYLLGDSIFQYSTIIGFYMFSMGLGAFFVQRVRDENLLKTFIYVELFVGIFGSFAVYGLFLLYGHSVYVFKPIMYFVISVIGMLVGSEIPLVIRMINFIENKTESSFANTISNVLSLDYMGALFVSIVFPMVLVPSVGIIGSSSVFGLINSTIAMSMIMFFILSDDEIRNIKISATISHTSFRTYFIVSFAILGVLSVFSWYGSDLVNYGEERIYGDIVLNKKTKYQKIMITKEKNSETKLYLNGNLQYSSNDETRYHESLVHLGMAGLDSDTKYNILVLGGGDGLAVRELLKYKNGNNLHITLVDLDAEMTNLSKNNNIINEINKHSLSNPDVKVINSDAALWVRQNKSEQYDFIIVDFPDPSNFSLGKLYSKSFYISLHRLLKPEGYMVVQSTSPFYAPNAFWCVEKTISAALFNTLPYHAPIPSFGGDWGYVLASISPINVNKIKSGIEKNKGLINYNYIDAAMIDSMFFFSKDLKPTKKEIEVNRLNNQSLVTYFLDDWQKALR